MSTVLVTGQPTSEPATGEAMPAESAEATAEVIAGAMETGAAIALEAQQSAAATAFNAEAMISEVRTELSGLRSELGALSSRVAEVAEATAALAERQADEDEDDPESQTGAEAVTVETAAATPQLDTAPPRQAPGDLRKLARRLRLW